MDYRNASKGTVLHARRFRDLPHGAYVNRGFHRYVFDVADGFVAYITRESADDSLYYGKAIFTSDDSGEYVTFWNFGVEITIYAGEFRQA